MFVASLDNNKTWQELPDGDKADYNFIKKLEDQLISLTGNVRSNKQGKKGHIGIMMTTEEFVLILNTLPFTLLLHPGQCDYDNPTPYGTN